MSAMNFVQIKIRVRDRELKRKAANGAAEPNAKRRLGAGVEGAVAVATNERSSALPGATEIKNGRELLGKDDASIRFQFS